MFSYFVFIVIVAIFFIFSEITRRYGFKNLTIRREIDKNNISEGEEFRVSIIIENNKWLPISFLLLKEVFPRGLELYGEETYTANSNYNYHNSMLSVMWHQRIRRSYSFKSLKRGTYLLKEIHVYLGDIFGFSTDEKLIEDYIELLVYPKLADLKKIKFETTSLYGDNIIRRWIYRDPIFIRGIREYTAEDRMKDIHWKSSLKMNKLMVKDFEYTSELEIVLILDVQCDDPYWRSIKSKEVERGISLAAALSKQAIKEGVPVGFWTDANILSYKNSAKAEIEPSINSLKNIMEMCARIDYTPRLSLNEYLIRRSKYFRTNCSYILISSYLNEVSIDILSKLTKKGYSIKLIDISQESSLPAIDSIEKLSFKGGVL